MLAALTLTLGWISPCSYCDYTMCNIHLRIFTTLPQHHKHPGTHTNKQTNQKLDRVSPTFLPQRFQNVFGFWKDRKRKYPLRADTQRLHQAGVSVGLEGGGGRGAGGAGGQLSARRGAGGDGQGHGAGLLLHPLDTKQDTSAHRHHVIFRARGPRRRGLLVFVRLTVPCFRRSRRQRQKEVHCL